MCSKLKKIYQKNDSQIILSAEIKESIEKYCDMSEEFVAWFNEIAEKKPKAFIPSKSLWNMFRISEVYKRQIIKYTRERFNEVLQKKLKTEIDIENFLKMIPSFCSFVFCLKC